ncbi:NAD-glutamate dehydrogenase [Jiella sp. 40Bstr34]|uniref:NAD-glutamate dehydrogenase n=2 Tax=Jiella pacifica TaxID=2696469 RepID=A0A6N9TAJ7_9HYPH|nr:NAD-glutamate dehydrogenase [Jiella pacifica]
MAGKTPIIAAVAGALGEDSAGAKLAPLLFARPPVDDLKAFDTAALAAAARVGAEALAAHRDGRPVVWIDQPEDFRRGGEPQDLVTVVSDDMAFLFDSLTAEIAERANEIHYISHPIIDVTRGEDGVLADFAASRPGEETRTGTRRTSLIQFAVDPMAVGAGGDSGSGSGLSEALENILAQVGHANRDFQAMRQRVNRAVEDLTGRAETMPEAERPGILEGARLLEWLRDDNFIFLGTCDYDYHGERDGEELERRQSEALGILSDPDIRILGRHGRPMATTPEIRKFLKDPAPLIVTKANARSVVHRRAYMDYVGVKQYDGEGRLIGELRIVGLFTSTAYTRSILTIPYVRQKAETVISRSRFHPQSHSGKALLNALESYPRDEVFQIDTDLLERFAATVVELGERPRVRVLTRIDEFDRFVSVIVYVPRDRYDSRLRERIGRLLAEAYDGHVSAYYPAFPEGLLARVHIIVGRSGEPTPEVDVERLEARITEMAKNWEDEFVAALAKAHAPNDHQRFATGLPGSYRDGVSPAEAVRDVAVIDKLSADAPLFIDFYRRDGDAEDTVRLKIYHLGKAVALSTRVPILENMGFGVVSERTFRLVRPDGDAVHLHDMDLVRANAGGPIPLDDDGKALEDVFGAVWRGRIENDGFNALVLEGGLDFRKANVMRAYSRYLRQGTLAYSPDYVANALVRHAAITNKLWQLFETTLDPEKGVAEGDTPSVEADEIETRQHRRAVTRGGADTYDAILGALDDVDSADDDRIVRRFLNVILATLRTNFFAVDGMSAEAGSEPGKVQPALAFKLDSSAVEGLPAPVPFREIFVFDARVEGVHLRFGSVARGGLRWSDRAQDYRTEVLGLVKAQQVKNAVIVPVGAKGGFYPKRLPDAAQRDQWFAAGRSAYVVFIASLLSVTDNIVGEGVVTPANVRRHDGDDPYFVVAADKGTATFSDTANAIAQSEDFWLDDAFASGGSAGYDHKAMGITARGAWEAVKRHFREIPREDGEGAWDIQSQPFTAAGCGDMSGDVFGNGMLLSRQTRLIAAFDHRDIFIDPDPDPEASFEERKRLFALPRSSWQDYDKAKISHGGGVFSRRDKVIRLSSEAAAAIGFDRDSGTPTEIISAILKAPVDLLWFGGIGTYLRASGESNVDVGDRSNDAVRVTASDVRAKVVGEGANLAVTQKGRIEFAGKGGRINSDAIDNSAGVNTSDVEVNIKIALKSAMSDGRLSREDRNRLLAAMTDEVAELVLANNYEQTLALSLEQHGGVSALALQSRFMSVLEAAGHLDRTVETLPSDAAIADRRSTGKGLTRPEIGVLLAYAKITLFDAVVASDLPDDPYLEDRLHDYFPVPMRRDFLKDIKDHRLAREIIATVLANEVVNRTGPTFVTMMEEATGASPGAVVRAFVAAKDGFDIRDLYQRIDALDAKLPGAVQNGLYRNVGWFLRRLTNWYVLNEGFGSGLTSVAIESRDALGQLQGRLAEIASEAARKDAESRAGDWARQGVPQDLAEEVAMLPLLALIPDIAAVSRSTGRTLEETVESYFEITRLFEIGRIEAALFRFQSNDYFETLALQRAESQIARARRQLTEATLKSGEAPDDWAKQRSATVDRIRSQLVALAGSGETSVARLTVAAGLLSDLVSREEFRSH